MDPSQYDAYSTVFNYFSHPWLFPALESFMLNVALPNLKENARVTDVGAGTAIFSAKLLDHMPSIQLTIIEPSAPMLAIAKKRLGDRANYYDATIEEVLPHLPQQDAFIFQRSLYAIYNNAAHCQKLFYQLNRKLSIGGSIFISDFAEKFDEEKMQAYLIKKLQPTTNNQAELSSRLQIMLDAVHQFNVGVDSGRFHLISERELDQLFNCSHFRKKNITDAGQYGYEKIADCNRPYWLHQGLRWFSQVQS